MGEGAPGHILLHCTVPLILGIGMLRSGSNDLWSVWPPSDER